MATVATLCSTVQGFLGNFVGLNGCFKTRVLVGSPFNGAPSQVSFRRNTKNFEAYLRYMIY